MELNSEVITTPPRPAATVVMLRDGSHGLEVFLVRRHGLSDVLGGAYVFPGGKVDAADALLDMDTHLDQALPVLHASLNEHDIAPTTAASLYVAAMREAFEESGILFAHGATHTHAAQATRLLREGLAFDTVLAQMALRLQCSSLLPWSRWITPKQPSVTNKRFDTRFFVAAVPNGQIARHDDHEATESVWLRPRAALEQYWEGRIEMAPPQIMSLVQLARHPQVHSILEAARQQRPALIAPEPFDDEGCRVICYPGDERHSVQARALVGPTRLIYRNKRFEPVAGFESLFD
jgi:8-oxo-dGTP pyrophosphatase MutT (NUDIX family)